jgi:hypothetical protein
MIYINADWINAGNLSLAQLTAVVLEEYGHALGTRLNPSLERAGDEGELFANLITNAGLNADQIAAINTQNDWGTVQVDGQTVVVEVVEQQVTASGISSTTPGATTTTQTINRETAQAISVTITCNGANNNGANNNDADILIAAYYNTTLLRWTICNRNTNLDAGNPASAKATLALTFNLAQFNPSFSSGGLNHRAWQGTAGGATAVGTANDTSPATTSGTSSTVPFAINATSATARNAAIPAAVDGASVTWTATSVAAVAPTATSSTSVTDDVSPVSGTVASGGSTNDTELVLAGTAEAISTVTDRNAGTSLGTVTAVSGAWSFTTATLNNGTIYTFNATATDAAGNVSFCPPSRSPLTRSLRRSPSPATSPPSKLLRRRRSPSHVQKMLV